jgi:hypothetical protein
MRKELENLGSDNRFTFTGVFERYGYKSGFKGYQKPTVLFRDICKDGQPVTDHLWFNLTKEFDRAKLKKGDLVKFDARVGIYEKGYKGNRAFDDWMLDHPIEEDYRLERPTKVKVIERSKP